MENENGKFHAAEIAYRKYKVKLVMLNLDKSYDYIEECMALARKTGTLHQILVKG